MQPLGTEVSVNELLEVINLVAPMIKQIWVLLAAILTLVISGAVWVTTISIRTKANTKAIENKDQTVDPAICSLHRDSCSREHAATDAALAATLIEIKDDIKMIQQSLLRSATAAPPHV